MRFLYLLHYLKVQQATSDARHLVESHWGKSTQKPGICLLRRFRPPTPSKAKSLLPVQSSVAQAYSELWLPLASGLLRSVSKEYCRADT